MFAPIEIYHDDPDPTSGMYAFAHIADTVSDSKADILYCGARTFTFDTANLITVNSYGSWQIKANSPSHVVGVL